MDALGYSRTETRVTQLPGAGGAYKGRLLQYLRRSAA